MKQTRGKGIQLSHAGRHLIAAKTKSPFDLEAQLHAVEAVHAELIEGGLGVLLGGRERAADSLGNHFAHGLVRLNGKFAQIE